MAFIFRGARTSDLDELTLLTSQFYVMNLPPKREVIQEKIKKSIKSFADPKVPRKDAEYLFILEDTESKSVIGCSLIMAKHGTPEVPHLYFQIRKEERFSHDLGIGFVHQVMRLKEDTNGPTEVGGLILDSSYRRRPERLGRQISLCRFVFMGLEPTRFEERILCELTPPLTAEGRSEFWEALGRRFTGLPYQEADRLSQSHKEFVQSLFPAGEIYLSLLSSEARLVVGRVGEATLPAKFLLESIGFKYLNEVDPFDGGPHFGAKLKDIKIVKNGSICSIGKGSGSTFQSIGLIGMMRGKEFQGCQTSYHKEGEEVYLPETTMESLGLKAKDKVFLSPVK